MRVRLDLDGYGVMHGHPVGTLVVVPLADLEEGTPARAVAARARLILARPADDE